MEKKTRLLLRFSSETLDYEKAKNVMFMNTNTSILEGKPISRRRQSYTNAIALALAIMIVLIILVVPLVTEYRVYVTIGQDVIIDVSGQRVSVPLISILSPAPSYPTGVYTIEVQVQTQQSALFLNDVPIGQYTFTLQNITSGVQYTITVYLIRNGLNITTPFTFKTTF